MSRSRIALISDVHGNELALLAVLADIEKLGVDRIACLGDVACLGPRPRECLERVRDACELTILGNHDEYLFDLSALSAHSQAPVIHESVAECRAALAPADVAIARGFSATLRVPLGQGQELMLFHGSPASNNRDLLAETPDAELEAELGPHGATLWAGGHTHVPLLRAHRGRWLVNPGSVGLPFERFVHGAPPTLLTCAQYAIVEASSAERALTVQLRRIELAASALLAAVADWDNPLAPFLREQYAR